MSGTRDDLLVSKRGLKSRILIVILLNEISSENVSHLYFAFFFAVLELFKTVLKMCNTAQITLRPYVTKSITQCVTLTLPTLKHMSD